MGYLNSNSDLLFQKLLCWKSDSKCLKKRGGQNVCHCLPTWFLKKGMRFQSWIRLHKCCNPRTSLEEQKEEMKERGSLKWSLTVNDRRFNADVCLCMDCLCTRRLPRFSSVTIWNVPSSFLWSFSPISNKENASSRSSQSKNPIEML